MYDKTHTWAEKAQGANAVSVKVFLNFYTFRSKLKNARATTRPSVVWKSIGITVTYIQNWRKVLDFKDFAVTMWNQNLQTVSLKL